MSQQLYRPFERSCCLPHNQEVTRTVYFIISYKRAYLGHFSNTSRLPNGIFGNQAQTVQATGEGFENGKYVRQSLEVP